MNKYILVFYFSIFIILLFTQFYHPVNGLYDDQMGIYTAEKVIENITPQEGYKTLMEKYIETGEVGLHPCTSYGIPWINPIYTLITHSYSQIVGLSIPKWHFLSVLLFIGVLYFAKKWGDQFFGKYGFVYPLLLVTNLYILVFVRNSIQLFTISLLLAFAAMHYLLKTHEQYSRKNLLLTALFLFLALSNGSTYSPITYLYLLVIFAGLFIWKKIIRKNENNYQLLNLKQYLFLFFLVPFLSLFSYFANDILLGTPLGSSLDGFFYFTKSKFPPTEYPTVMDKIGNSILKYKEIFAGTSFRELFGPHATFFPYKTPVLDIVAAILFILGLLNFLRSFTYKKLIMMIFLLYTSYFLYNVGAARMFDVFVPFLLMVSASGFVFLIELFKILKINRVVIMVILGFFIALSIKNVIYFDRYFVVESNSNMGIGAGILDIQQYIDKIPDDKFLVYMQNYYPTWYLSGFLDNKFLVNKAETPESFRSQMDNLQALYKNVVVIFPSNFYFVGNPGAFTGFSWGDFENQFAFFTRAYPELTKPDLTVYDYQGIPLHYVYIFSASKINSRAKVFTFDDEKKSYPLGINGEIKTIKIYGSANSLLLGSGQELKINSSPYSIVTLNFQKESNYTFYKNYTNSSYQDRRIMNIDTTGKDQFAALQEGNLGVIDLKPDGGSYYYTLEYLYELPYKITKVEERVDMRIFNSYGSHAGITGYVVDDERYFPNTIYPRFGNNFQVFKVESDNSGSYGPGGEDNVLNNSEWDVGRLGSYTIKKTNSNKVLISYLYRSMSYNKYQFLAQLYTKGNSSFVKFTVDTTKLEAPTVNDESKFSIVKDKNDSSQTVVEVIY